MYAAKRAGIFGLVLLFWALSAFPQAGLIAADQDRATRPPLEDLISALPGSAILAPVGASATAAVPGTHERQIFDVQAWEPQEVFGHDPGSEERIQPSDRSLKLSKPPDFN